MTQSTTTPQAVDPDRSLENWFPLILLILIQLANGMRDIPQFAFFVIYLQDQLRLKPVEISSVVAGAQIVGMLTALLGGIVASRLGSKWVLAGGIALSGLSSLAFQVHSFWLVVPLWWLGGAGGALTAVAGASYLTKISGRKALGILAAFYALSVTAGGALGNPLAAILITKAGFSALSSAILILSAGQILLVSLWMPRIQGASVSVASLRAVWAGIRATTSQTNVRLVTGLRCLPTIYYGMLTVLIPLILYNLSGSKLTVAAFGTTNLILASLTQLAAGRAADRWGARAPSLAAYLVLIVSGIGLSLSAGTLWGIFVFGVLGNAAAWSLSTMMYVWVNDGVPKDQHPATFGLLHAVWSLSMVSGSVVGGWFVSSIPWLPFLLGAILNSGSLFLIFIYYRRLSASKAAQALISA